MGKKEYLKMTYDSYFERLNGLARHIERLREISAEVPTEQRAALNAHINSLESDFDDYAKYLSETGIQVLKNVA